MLSTGKRPDEIDPVVASHISHALISRDCVVRLQLCHLKVRIIMNLAKLTRDLFRNRNFTLLAPTVPQTVAEHQPE